MKALYDVAAPAKLNLFLHVNGRRSDSYHLIQSVFMLIDWHDTLHFELRPNGQLSREDLGTPLPEDDLILRAARALQRATHSTVGARITVDKRIPSEAGMGGGSSDAASCLLALNRLWRTGLDTSQLMHLGLSLGADVPFFLGGHNAWVEGIGEQLTPVDVPECRFVVIKPAGGLETRRIFTDPALQRDTETAIISGFAANPFAFGRNDLQPVAERLLPGISEALAWLQSQGLSGRMTGSGSAVFAPLHSGQSIQSPPPAGWHLQVCSNLDVHPLMGWAPSDGSSVAG